MMGGGLVLMVWPCASQMDLSLRFVIIDIDLAEHCTTDYALVR